MSAPTIAEGRVPAGDCPHIPPCPAADAPDALAARILVDRPEQGWTLRCNGLVMVDSVPLTGPVR